MPDVHRRRAVGCERHAVSSRVVRHRSDLGLEGGDLATQKPVELGHVRREVGKNAGKCRSSGTRGGRGNDAAHGGLDVGHDFRNDQPIPTTLADE